MKVQFGLIDDDHVALFLHKEVIRMVVADADIKSFDHPCCAADYFSGSSETHSSPSIIFLDINMPVMSGWELLDALHQLPESRRKDLFVFMLSSSPAQEDIDKADNHPLVVKYLEKPIHPRYITDALEHVKTQVPRQAVLS